MDSPFGKRLALVLILLLLLAAAPAALAAPAGPATSRDLIPAGIPTAGSKLATAAAPDATVTYVFGKPTATLLGTEATTSSYFTGSGAWRESLSAQKFELPIDPVALFGASFTIDQISSLTYHTNTVTPGAVDFFMTLYTVPCVGGNASWYCHRITAEPMYFNGFVTPTPGTWNTYSTDAGSNQFTFYDSNNNGGVFGSYPQPTLQDIQSGPITWNTYMAGGSSTPIDYGPETVKYIYLSTGSGTSATFDGYLDAVTISLTNGNTYNIDLEASVAEAWVDDDYTTATPGWGVDHFASIQAGIDAVLAGGTVNVYPGTYNETAASRYLYSNVGPYQFGLFFADEKPGVTVQGLKADGSPITAYADVAATVTTNATNSFGTSGVFVEADNTTIAGLRIGANVPGDNKTI